MKRKGYHMCSSCEAGEIMDEPADVKVHGTYGDGRPCRAWLCIDHFDMIMTDGAKVRVVEKQDVTGFYQ